MSFTKTTVVGNLGQDPELRYMPNGNPVTTFSICANQRTGSGANKSEEPIWFKASVFGNSAEAVAQHLKKGDQVYVEGRLKPELWKGRDGETRLTLGINTSDVQFLGMKRRNADAGDVDAEAAGEPNSDDIPF